jgi:regulator of sirC expression with transglutaminase-like and TPR domain
MSRALLRWRELDDWVGAIDDFTTLLTQYPSQHEALFNRGMAHYRAGDYHASAIDLAAFIQRDPDSRWVHHAKIQLQGLYSIIDDLPKQLPPPDIPILSPPQVDQ